MGLYDRNYTAQDRNIGAVGAFADENALVSFVKTTYKFLAASLLFATIGALVGFMYFDVVTQPGVRIGLFIAEIATLLGLMFLRSSPGLNVALLFIFTTLTGVVLVPLLGLVIAKDGVSVVWQAFGMTTIIFGVMSLFALKTKADLSQYGKMLFIALIVILVCSIINIFLGSTLFHTLIAAGIVVLFSIYIAYDTQNIVRGLYESPVIAAISLYLDIYYIFTALLSLLSSDD